MGDIASSSFHRHLDNYTALLPNLAAVSNQNKKVGSDLDRCSGEGAQQLVCAVRSRQTTNLFPVQVAVLSSPRGAAATSYRYDVKPLMCERELLPLHPLSFGWALQVSKHMVASVTVSPLCATCFVPPASCKQHRKTCKSGSERWRVVG
ncbi:hypothetical protein V5799_003941 [Amblyomma americanum]|uniref:Uncharacterized protein n=1 Tax=Amblyomma americanum TaxID=6943 RepID=A0AAQ4D7J0_AMBAM